VHSRSCRRAAVIALIFAQGMVPALAQQRRMEIGLLIAASQKARRRRAELRQWHASVRRGSWTFVPTYKRGRPEEAYTGWADSVGMEKELPEKRAMIWVVKRTGGTIGSTGQLQQVYAADLAANPGQSPPLIGEANGSLVLETLADARAAVPNDEKRISTAMIVLVNLILKSAPA
jgi:hypothetical protein